MQTEQNNPKIIFDEIKFVESFINTYKYVYSTNLAEVPNGKNQSTYADCEIVYNDHLIKIEAKLLNDIRNNSGEFHKLLGELITTHNKASKIKSQNTKECMGILIPVDKKNTFLKYWQRINSKDAKVFCEFFDLRYLILFDCKTKDIWFQLYDIKTNTWDK